MEFWSANSVPRPQKKYFIDLEAKFWRPTMTHLTINGTPVEVPEGTMVLRAAEKLGITIPTLCDHPDLKP